MSDLYNTTNSVANAGALIQRVIPMAILSLLPGLVQAELISGPQGALTVGIDSEFEYNSNVGLNDDENGDFIISVLPKLIYRYDQGAVRVDAFAGVRVDEYDDFNDISSDSFRSEVELTFPYGDELYNYSAQINAGYNEITRGDADLQDAVDKEILHLDVNGKYVFTDRYYALAGVLYRDQKTVSGNFDDVETITVPVDFFYRYSEDLSFGLGYRYRTTEVSGATTADSDDHAFYGAAEGRLTPTVDGALRVGYQQRDFEQSTYSDDDSLFAEAALSWTCVQDCTVELSFGREQLTSLATQSVESTYVNLEWDYPIDAKLTATLGVGYEDRDYTDLDTGDFDRNDEIVTVQASGDYNLIDERLWLTTKLSVEDRSSSEDTWDFMQTKVSAALAWVY